MTPEQRKNLLTLAAYLSTGKTAMQFDMGKFCINAHRALGPSQHTCGTIACAVGHGPVAGIAPLEDISWAEYCCPHPEENQYVQSEGFPNPGALTCGYCGKVLKDD